MDSYRSRIAKIDSLSAGPMKEVLDYWNAARRTRIMPARANIRPEDMLSYLSQVMLVDVPDSYHEMTYRVFGIGLALAVGRDYTRYRIVDLEPSSFALVVFKDYSEVAIGSIPVLREVEANVDDISRRYQRLVLPLGATDEKVDGLLVVSTIDRHFWGEVAAEEADPPPVADMTDAAPLEVVGSEVGTPDVAGPGIGAGMVVATTGDAAFPGVEPFGTGPSI